MRGEPVVLPVSDVSNVRCQGHADRRNGKRQTYPRGTYDLHNWVGRQKIEIWRIALRGEQLVLPVSDAPNVTRAGHADSRNAKQNKTTPGTRSTYSKHLQNWADKRKKSGRIALHGEPRLLSVSNSQGTLPNAMENTKPTPELGRHKIGTGTDCPARGTSCALGIRPPRRHIPRAMENTKTTREAHTRSRIGQTKDRNLDLIALRGEPHMLSASGASNVTCPRHADRRNGKHKTYPRGTYLLQNWADTR